MFEVLATITILVVFGAILSAFAAIGIVLASALKIVFFPVALLADLLKYVALLVIVPIVVFVIIPIVLLVLIPLALLVIVPLLGFAAVSAPLLLLVIAGVAITH